MLDAAMASGNEGEVATIVKYASTAWPENAEAIAKLASDWVQKRTDAKTAKLQDTGIFDLWSGKAELGGFVSTGNGDAEGFPPRCR